jgi:hypothetical protein
VLYSCPCHVFLPCPSHSAIFLLMPCPSHSTLFPMSMPCPSYRASILSTPCLSNGVWTPAYTPADRLTSWMYSTTCVQYLYISCYLSDNKPVLSYLLLRLLPQELHSCPCIVLPTELYICTCPFFSSYISGLHTVCLIILSKDIYFFPIPLCFHLSWALVSPQAP